MLALSRKVDQSVVITVPPSSEPTRIDVLLLDRKPRGQQVTLGFSAPERVVIHRDEIQRVIDGGVIETAGS